MTLIDRAGRWVVLAAFALVFIHVALYLAGVTPDEFLARAERLLRATAAAWR